MTDSYQFSQIYPHHHNHYNTLVPFFTLVTAFTAGICSAGRQQEFVPSDMSRQHHQATVTSIRLLRNQIKQVGWKQPMRVTSVSSRQLFLWFCSFDESASVKVVGCLNAFNQMDHCVTLSTACKSTSSSEQISDEFPAIKMQVIFGFVMFLSFL